MSPATVKNRPHWFILHLQAHTFHLFSCPIKYKRIKSVFIKNECTYFKEVMTLQIQITTSSGPIVTICEELGESSTFFERERLNFSRYWPWSVEKEIERARWCDFEAWRFDWFDQIRKRVFLEFILVFEIRRLTRNKIT